MRRPWRLHISALFHRYRASWWNLSSEAEVSAFHTTALNPPEFQNQCMERFPTKNSISTGGATWGALRVRTYNTCGMRANQAGSLQPILKLHINAFKFAWDALLALGIHLMKELQSPTLPTEAYPHFASLTPRVWTPQMQTPSAAAEYAWHISYGISRSAYFRLTKTEKAWLYYTLSLCSCWSSWQTFCSLNWRLICWFFLLIVWLLYKQITAVKLTTVIKVNGVEQSFISAVKVTRDL